MVKTIIYGPPGTGKTTYLKNLVQDVMKKEEDAKYLILSFSKAAAREIAGRLRKVKGSVQVNTLHSFCYHYLDLTPSQVMDDESVEKFAEWTSMVSLDVTKALSKYGLKRCMYPEIKEVYNYPQMSNAEVELVKQYETYKERLGLIDFDDMLALTLKNTNDDGMIFINRAYDHIIIDEAQDLSDLHWAVIKSIPYTKTLTVAGDDDQTIYSFNGADNKMMVEGSWFHNQVTLSQSYRVPKKIQDVANSIISDVKNRKLKDWKPRDSNGEVVWAQSLTALGALPKGESATVLVRDRWIEAEVRFELDRLGIPYNPSPFTSKWKKKAFDEGNFGRLKPREIVYMNRAKKHFDENGVILDLSTIHKSKGKEWDNVILVCSMSSTSQMSQYDFDLREEESRVWYVACTRAKRRLIIIGSNYYVKKLR